MDKQKTVANSIRAYLPPLYSRLAKAHANYTGESESEIVVTAVKKFYNEMPADEKQKILNIGGKKDEK
ncbi:MAG TPA: hypothetical protein VN722_08490 [Hanamia sp.]|nr:hypothetical protein [Hanamia sp.]